MGVSEKGARSLFKHLGPRRSCVVGIITLGKDKRNMKFAKCLIALAAIASLFSFVSSGMCGDPINGLDQLESDLGSSQLADIARSLGHELSLEIARGPLLTGLSATGWQNVGFERSSNSGATFTEPAWTLGSRLEGFPVSLAFNYTYLDFTKYNGKDIEESLAEEFQGGSAVYRGVPFPGYRTEYSVADGTGGGFDTLRAHVYSFTGTMGLLHNLDLSVVVPIISVDVSGRASGGIKRQIFDNTGSLISSVENQFNAPLSGGGTGIGDVMLRLKYGLFQERAGHPVSLAIGYDLKTPTGDEDKILGTGEFDNRVRLLIGKQLLDGLVYPTAELSYLFSGSGGEYDTFEYRLALPFLAKKWYTSDDPETRIVKHSLTLAPELVGRISDNADKLDGGVSARFAFGQNLLFQAGLRTAIKDDEGLVAPWVPTMGVEYRF